MVTVNLANHSADTRSAVPEPQQFPPLELVNRPTVPTEQAAHYLLRRPQTLRAVSYTHLTLPTSDLV